MLNKGPVVITPGGGGWGFLGITWFSGGRSGVANIVWRRYWILTAIGGGRGGHNNIAKPYEGSGEFYYDKILQFLPPPLLAVYYKSSILSPEQDDSNASRDWLDIFNFVIVCSEFVFFLLQLQILNSKEKLESQRKLWKEVWYYDVKVITLSRKTCKVTLSIKIVAEVGETWGNEKLGKFYWNFSELCSCSC